MYFVNVKTSIHLFSKYDHGLEIKSPEYVFL